MLLDFYGCCWISILFLLISLGLDDFCGFEVLGLLFYIPGLSLGFCLQRSLWAFGWSFWHFIHLLLLLKGPASSGNPEVQS